MYTFIEKKSRDFLFSFLFLILFYLERKGKGNFSSSKF